MIWAWTSATKRNHDPDEVVTIAEFAAGADARLWKMRLESQGVECIILGETPVTRASLVPNTDLAAVRLQVLGRDAGRARRILSQS